MEWSNEKTYGIIGTIVFHVALILLFLVLAFRTPLPLPGEEGVEVNLGFSNQGMGRKPQTKAPKTAPAPKKVVQAAPKQEASSSNDVKEDLLTQNTEEAPALPVDNKKDKKKKEDTQKAKEEVKGAEKAKPKDEVVEEQKPQEAEEVVEEKPKVNKRALYKGPSSNNKEGGGNEGNTGQPGNQGQKNGILDAKKYVGAGGLGNGISFNLGGRGAKNIPKPKYTSQEQGRVVVTIWVDQEGNVIRAKAGGKGTNVTDQSLWNMAVEAAKKAKFATDPNAPSTQKGTITYNFIRRN